jgi:hypothetical protein
MMKLERRILHWVAHGSHKNRPGTQENKAKVEKRKLMSWIVGIHMQCIEEQFLLLLWPHCQTS